MIVLLLSLMQSNKKSRRKWDVMKIRGRDSRGVFLGMRKDR